MHSRSLLRYTTFKSEHSFHQFPNIADVRCLFFAECETNCKRIWSIGRLRRGPIGTVVSQELRKVFVEIYEPWDGMLTVAKSDSSFRHDNPVANVRSRELCRA